MRILLDTNVLLRMVQPSHAMHQLVFDAVAVLRQRGDEFVIVPQSLYEMWVVCTRPVAQNGVGLSAAEAQAELAQAKSLCPLLDDLPGMCARWEQLVTHHQVLGKGATMPGSSPQCSSTASATS